MLSLVCFASPAKIQELYIHLIKSFSAENRECSVAGNQEGGLYSNWYYVLCLVTQSCPTLCDPMNYSPLGSSVHGILQARTLEWVAMPFTR